MAIKKGKKKGCPALGAEIKREDFIKWFSELTKESGCIAGGKGASLAEMYNNKFPIPPGFVVTAQAYQYFIEKSGIKEEMHKILSGLDVNDTEGLYKSSDEIRKLMESKPFPKELEEEILEAYDILDVGKKDAEGTKGDAGDILRSSHEKPFVAVRSSATAEDLVDASFAGQQESFLNVKGEKQLLEKIKKCFSSLFTPRATFYREKKNFEHEKTYLAAVIQKMVDSDKSGVMFSTNPLKKDDTIMIEAVFGLGEGIVSGKIKPDNYVISKDVENLDIRKQTIAEKKIAITRNASGEDEVVKLKPEISKKQVLTNYEIKRLSQYAVQLEEHYGLPQDIEFAIEGEKLYIVQSRPITTKASDEAVGEIEGTAILEGMGASPGIGSGVVRIVHSKEDLDKVKQGDILVTEMTNPDMVVSMQKSAGIITDEGGATSHAAIVSREMGIAAVVGTGNATEKLKDGQVVTVDGSNGKVYEGRTETKKIEIKPVVPTKTKIKVIVDLPDFAERAAKSQAKAIGLTRLEGIIAVGGKHPLGFVKKKNMKPYIEIISNGLKKIAQPFEEVWVRSSDIRSDEYTQLEGAPKEIEGNPMMGDHGIRFGLRHPEILKAEFQAVKEVADEYPDKKIGLMIPLVVKLDELVEAKRIAREEVVVPKNVRIGIMVETPAAVQIIDKFCDEGIDFISFGTNDLTQFTLAIDRNNSDVQYLFDETHPAVVKEIEHVIKVCKERGVETSICGQAGSKPAMAKVLVKAGIDSISVNPDAAFKISEVVAKVESELDGGGDEVAEQKNVNVIGTDSGVGGEGDINDISNGEDKMKEIEGIVRKESGGDIKDKDESGVGSSSDDNLDKKVNGGKDVREEEKAPEGNEPIFDDRDIQDVILQQLEMEREAEEKNEVPALNDAIPVDSTSFEKDDKEEEIEVSDKGEELKKEDVEKLEEISESKDDVEFEKEGSGDNVNDKNNNRIGSSKSEDDGKDGDDEKAPEDDGKDGDDEKAPEDDGKDVGDWIDNSSEDVNSKDKKSDVKQERDEEDESRKGQNDGGDNVEDGSKEKQNNNSKNNIEDVNDKADTGNNERNVNENERKKVSDKGTERKVVSSNDAKRGGEQDDNKEDAGNVNGRKENIGWVSRSELDDSKDKDEEDGVEIDETDAEELVNEWKSDKEKQDGDVELDIF